MRSSSLLKNSPLTYGLQNLHIIYIGSVTDTLKRSPPAADDTLHNALHVINSCDIPLHDVKKALKLETYEDLADWISGAAFQSASVRTEAVSAIIALLEAEHARLQKGLHNFIQQSMGTNISDDPVLTLCQ